MDFFLSCLWSRRKNVKWKKPRLFTRCHDVNLFWSWFPTDKPTIIYWFFFFLMKNKKISWMTGKFWKQQQYLFVKLLLNKDYVLNNYAFWVVERFSKRKYLKAILTWISTQEFLISMSFSNDRLWTFATKVFFRTLLSRNM